jgi:hypothetical protein
MLSELSITTLAYSTLTIGSVKYIYENDKLTIRITTTAPHGIFTKNSSANLNLSNVFNVNINGIANYLNTQIIKFKHITTTILEAQILWSEESFLQSTQFIKTYNFIDLPNNGTAIVAVVNNKILSLENISTISYCYADTVANGGYTNPVGNGANTQCTLKIGDFIKDTNTNIELLASQLSTSGAIVNWSDLLNLQYYTSITKNVRFILGNETDATRIIIMYRTL